MKTWINRSLIALAGAGIVLGSLTACGHRMHHGGWRGDATPEQQAGWRGKMVDRVTSKLDFDAEPKAKLAVLSEKLQAQRQGVRDATDPRAAVQSLVAGATFDRAKAQALVQQKADAVRTGSPEVITALGDFYDSLNPAQQQRVRDFMQKRRGGRRG